MRDATAFELRLLIHNAICGPRRYEPCANCATRLPPRQGLTGFAAGVLAERARLALVDPEGECDAVAPLDGVKARAILLHLAEPDQVALGPAPARREVDQRELLDRLGADLTRDHGLLRCPAHEDRSASLSWRWDGSTALVHCFRGCSFAEIRAAL